MAEPRVDPDRNTPESVRAAGVAAVASGDPDALRPLVLRRGDDGRWRYARGMTNGLPAPPP